MTQRTKNIKFCAYLRTKNINPSKVEKIARGKGSFLYDMSDEDWQKHKMEFNNSPLLDYANAIDAIKDLCYKAPLG